MRGVSVNRDLLRPTNALMPIGGSIQAFVTVGLMALGPSEFSLAVVVSLHDHSYSRGTSWCSLPARCSLHWQHESSVIGSLCFSPAECYGHSTGSGQVRFGLGQVSHSV